MTLTICIPTFNRAPKLGRTITLLREQISGAGLQDRVSILVSDNASTDATATVVADAAALDDGVHIGYQCHSSNIGGCLNILSLYEAAEGQYVWIFSDDDIPFENAVAKVYAALGEVRPDLLLFSFVQPPGSTVYPFRFPEPIHIESDPEQCARWLMHHPKISIYVFRKVEISADLMDTTRRLAVTCAYYGFNALGLSIFSTVEQPKVAIISEPLAGCDDQFSQGLRFTAPDWEAEARIVEHPFLIEHAPKWRAAIPRSAYTKAFWYLWAWRAGVFDLDPSYEEQWWETVRNFRAQWQWLSRPPRQMVKFLAFKAAPGHLPRLMEPMISRARHLVTAVKRRTRSGANGQGAST